MSDPATEVKAWLEENWDPDLTVGQWWERMGMAGWSAPTFPEEWYGKGVSNAENVQVQRTIREFGALRPPGGLGLLLAGPTIVTHGTDEQKQQHLPDIVCGRKGWCQLFSEPVAGSDLAGIQARAVRDGDEWIVNGQKVWTSSAHIADLGMLVARTNVEVPKHKGLTYFLLDMHQPGIEVRPLRELTGRALFNEVFMTDVRVHNDAILGGLDNGWAVTNTTLMGLRLRALRGAGQDLPGAGNMAKLRMSEMFRLAREVGLSILGARGMLHDYQRRGAGDDANALDRGHPRCRPLVARPVDLRWHRSSATQHPRRAHPRPPP